ncbi:Hypothetical protein I596_3552 [Dokdonella koreensis DS-123]|uniref:Uncharacterized protein n=1 Tax=Dokdonella koreensis DS-123 TaxID=1300342 RepID=A0A160DYJ9_9GAMM|nr:Hypothetical protein I596_3552 [Dokdonella koreensis DS-123]
MPGSLSAAARRQPAGARVAGSETRRSHSPGRHPCARRHAGADVPASGQVIVRTGAPQTRT